MNLSHEITPLERLNLRHLEAELARITVLIQREVRRWQMADQDIRDEFRGLYVSDSMAEAMARRPLGATWGQSAALAEAEEAGFSAAYVEAQNRVEELAGQIHAAGDAPRLETLGKTFGLDDFARDAFLICLAPSMDLRYERLYGYLQDDVTRRRPSIDLVLNLLCGFDVERLVMLRDFDADAPLFRHHLLEWAAESSPGRVTRLNRGLAVDETVMDWLLGKARLHPTLETAAQLRLPVQTVEDGLLAGDALERLEHALEGANAPDNPVLIHLYGADEMAQDACARLLAAKKARPLLELDLAAAAELAGDIPLSLMFDLAARDAQINGALLYFKHMDVLAEDGEIKTAALYRLLRAPGPVLVSSRMEWHPSGLTNAARVVHVETGLPPVARRLALWNQALGTAATGLDLHPLAGQFALASKQILDAASAARDAAAQNGTTLGMDALYAAARQFSSLRLSGLARKVKSHYGWSDIILPEDQVAMLREITAMVRNRQQVLGAWGLGRKLVPSYGVTVLFSGQPGTGKTMSAEVMASDLGLDLYKIDLSSVVSKYIGETEKNLERIFQEASSSSAILFFDEADALFGKRSEVRDAHDRYANIEISYLLQRMESYDGVTILATNLRANLDEAFVRRLQFAVEFPFPGEADRLRIWKTLFPGDAPRREPLDFERLARQFKLPGGNIRNILVTAAYRAASDGGLITMEHLLHGARREMQKIGRLVDEEEFRFDVQQA